MFQDASQDVGFCAQLEAALLSDLRAGAAQAVNSHIDLALRDDSGDLIAGLSATTSYGWVHVNMIWVARDRRGAGHGRALMTAAMDQGRARGCHGVWLDTSSAQARAFYLELGFEDFGVLTNDATTDTPDHTRWFLRRSLTISAAP